MRSDESNVFPSQRTEETDEGRQFVVCGDTTLAYRLTEELTSRYRANVTVILAEPGVGHGPAIARMGRVRVVQATQPDADAFRAAGLTNADAVALVSRNDIGNVYAALQAQEICPDVRVVLRVHNSTLGQRLGELFSDAQVLSDVEIAAPAFVAAALGAIDPTSVRIGDQSARATLRSSAEIDDILAGLAVNIPPDAVVLLPDDESLANVVLVRERIEPPAPPAAPRHTARRLLHNIRRALFGANSAHLVSPVLVWAIGVLGGIVACGVVAFWAITPKVSLPESVYLMLFTAVGAGNADLDYTPWMQIVQTTVTLAGVAMLPLVSAAIVQASVHARLALPPGALVAPESDHVVVVGLGNLGLRIVRALHERGVEVVGVDHQANPVGGQFLHDNRIHFIVGDARRESTLDRANVANAKALVVVTTDDVTNLEYALQGRRLCNELRVVLRLFDGDFADRVNRTFDITISRSVSYLAAPAFAAAMVGREVIGTIPVRRRVLLVADVPVLAGSWLVGRDSDAIRDPGEVRVLAMVEAGTTIWATDWTRPLRAGDRLIVVATRTGLSWILGQSSELAVG